MLLPKMLTRRRATILAGCLALLVALAAATWFLAIPNWRPDRAEGEVYALDVSNHQGPIDWAEVAGDDIGAAYIKASEGGSWVDARFAENWRGAGEAGLRRGAYHFFTLCVPGAEQAANFLRVAPPDPEALPPSVDLEFPGNCSAPPSPEAVNAEVDAFLTAVEKAWGRKVLLYVQTAWDEQYPVRHRGDRPLWDRSFPRQPEAGWAMWQLHGWAYVDGVEGRVDFNLLRTSQVNVPPS